MKRSILFVCTAFLLCLCVPATALGQALNTNTGDQVFRLDDTATSQQGCFAPCLCPIQSPQPMRGTMVLGAFEVGDAFDFREIRQIRWYVSDQNDNDIHTITGSGMYFRSNFGAPQVHGLDLELQIDGGEPIHFFSDLETVQTNDGSFAIQVTMSDMVCFDIVLQVDAAAIGFDQITEYKVRADSTYQHGCWDPCDCPLLSPVPMTGSFKLVPLRLLGTYVEYAVVDMQLTASFANNDKKDDIHIEGGGLYTLIAGFAGMIESMSLELSRNGGPIEHFDSGFFNSGEEFPDINIAVDMNDLECFDVRLDIRASVAKNKRPSDNVSSNARSDSR